MTVRVIKKQATGLIYREQGRLTMFEMGDLFNKVKDMQSQMQKIQENLGKQTVEGSSGGGMVRVVCTGHQLVQSVIIDKTVLDPDDAEMLQDLITAAVNDGLKKSRELMEKEMGPLAGGLEGLSIPGLS